MMTNPEGIKYSMPSGFIKNFKIKNEFPGIYK